MPRSGESSSAVYHPSVAGYEQLPGLENVYLEDSWVLGVYESESSLSFDFDGVLTETHPRWQPPKPGEVHCYLRMELTFPSVRAIEWLARGTRPAVDATGEEDWGHIDTFEFDGDSYELSGDWGHVRLTSARPQISER